MRKSLKKKNISVEELTKGYEQFIKGKKLKKDGEKEFQRTIKKAANPKQRGSK